jgi:protein-tyrosine-phosphatase
MRKVGVLFVCYGNSCRSILAEALARHSWGDRMRTASAGIVPLGHVTAHTLEVLEEAGIPCDGLRSKGLLEINCSDFQYIVNLTDIPLDGFLPPSCSGQILSCYVRDPYGEGLRAFRRARDEIKWLIESRIPGLIARESSSGPEGR